MGTARFAVKPPSADGRALRTVVAVVAFFGVIVPIFAGLWLTLRAAFGVLPTLGHSGLSLAPFAQLAEVPGLARAIWLSLFTGGGATLIALCLALALASWLDGRMSPKLRLRLIAPILAVPHAALAIGLAFVLAPSGWIARLLAPVAGWERPPMLSSVNDEWGIALLVGLMVKEVPFLVFMALAGLGQIPHRRQMASARALGYSEAMVWLKVIMPQLWPLIRLPMLVVLAYGVSVVDMALILGPATPATLSVVLLRLFTSPDTALLLPASAGALVQIGVLGVAIGLVFVAEAAIRAIGVRWARRGARAGGLARCLPPAAMTALAVLALGGAAMVSLMIWSVAWRWSWPAILPESGSLQLWRNPGSGWGSALCRTLIAAAASTMAALVMAIAWLDAEDRGTRGRAPWAEALIYVPLLLPQIAFLAGLNVLFLRLGLSGSMIAVIWAHALFVFPYIMIALSDPWRALDPRMSRSAAALGAGPWRRLWAVKLPALLAPILAAAAIGIAVSTAQYLPTLFMGAGRIATLTTEAVTLASGADRRVTGVYATLQATIPLVGFALAVVIPARRHRNRRGLRGGGYA